MDKQQIFIAAEKVKSFGIALVGIVIFSLGTSYFQERLLYRVPRILIPVYDLLGNIGLATGMLLLGGAFIAYGYTKWKKVSQKKSIYWIIAIAGMLVGSMLANIDFKSSKEIMDDIDQQRERQIDEIRNLGKHNFDNPDIDRHFAEFDSLYKCFEQCLQTSNQTGIDSCENEFMEWSTKSGDFMTNLSNDEKYELAQYLAKQAISWDDLRQKMRERRD
ncbi:MAG: hypothetical protein LBD45_08960 [Bacteroidales bacterium]|jgi:hypothetical protein|nr:hypothetical protein [Bacteroidales bacterium]